MEKCSFVEIEQLKHNKSPDEYRREPTKLPKQRVVGINNNKRKEVNKTGT